MEFQLEELIKNIVIGMLDFIEDEDDADYNESDVAKCKASLEVFVEKLSSNGIENEDAFSAIETLVISLNKLNESCDECLIETDQREEICELIFMALSQANIPFEGDPTEEWREW